MLNRVSITLRLEQPVVKLSPCFHRIRLLSFRLHAYLHHLFLPVFSRHMRIVLLDLFVYLRCHHLREDLRLLLMHYSLQLLHGNVVQFPQLQLVDPVFIPHIHKCRHSSQTGIDLLRVIGFDEQQRVVHEIILGQELRISLHRTQQRLLFAFAYIQLFPYLHKVLVL